MGKYPNIKTVAIKNSSLQNLTKATQKGNFLKVKYFIYM